MDFNEQLRLFCERVGDRRAMALILTGSGQTDTAALLLAALQPQRVAFLLTPETNTFPERVAQQIELSPDPNWLREEVHYTDIKQVYRALRTIIGKWSDLPREQMLVDLTAGTKVMSVGLAKAAYALDLGTIYIESDYQQNKPVPGTQRLIDPPDPYEVFGDLEAEEAARAFNTYDYLSAARIYADLARRVPEPDQVTYAALAQLAIAYTQWEAFDLQAAAQTLQRLLSKPLPGQLAVHHHTLQAQQAALARLVQTIGAMAQPARALATLQDLDAVLPLLGSLHTNALRREAQQRYDTAALLRYRCLELISQHRLATHGVLAEEPDLDTLKKRVPNLDQRYRQIERATGLRERGLQPNRDGTYSSITLLNGYLLLAALNDPLMESVRPLEIRRRSRARNQSILAHGFRQISEAEYRDFVTVVEQLLDQFFAIGQRSRSDWEALYRFVTV
ncbi:CRISPR-associated protein [Chloroflexus islandicus]|uniref:CRISPR-associated protein n=1 Tax=Chloroflexus islandicus TaxID=1707952 RepID=A0A178M561_9CHLR|nr:TIGR02710 family CRISPR-associated CARF protein [Chloroflexus islandicus]OAN43899.1 CRISPR-associated protein [Chloroflexus islandicus]